MPAIAIPPPALQIDFSFTLGQIRGLYLQDALSYTIEKLDLDRLNSELSLYVPQESLKALARHGLRGELVYAAPCVLEANPYILGYYRLLLGFSQKEFYSSRFGVSGFKTMETRGVMTPRNRAALPKLCRALASSASALVAGIGETRLSTRLLDDLCLLTLGPQLRGGANVRKGAAAIIDVFRVIHEIVEGAAENSSEGQIEIRNAAGRNVFIQFAPDPDIVIREEMGPDRFRNIIAIEVKGGTDFSNIHNRVGEAEKSHQKARALGYVECWTVVNVDAINMDIARRESPSTNRFFRLSDLKSRFGDAYRDFRELIIALTGIKSG